MSTDESRKWSSESVEHMRLPQGLCVAAVVKLVSPSAVSGDGGGCDGAFLLCT